MNFYNNIEKFYGFAGPRGGIVTTYYGPSSSSTSSTYNMTEIDKEYERLFGSGSTTSSGASSYHSRSGSSSYTGDSSRGSSSGSSSNSGQTQISSKSSETTDFSQYLPLAAVGIGLLLGAVLLK